MNYLMAGHHEHGCRPVLRSLIARMQIREHMTIMRSRNPIPSPSKVLMPLKLLSFIGTFFSVSVDFGI